jgi:hypothetical protein
MLTKLALLRHHEGRVANATVHVQPLGATGLGELSPAWASKVSGVEFSNCVKFRI